MELISGSIGSARARIRFYRIPFGSASDQPLGRSETSKLLGDIERAGRGRIRWNPTEPVQNLAHLTKIPGTLDRESWNT